MGMGTQIPCDELGATAVPGVWVAGNVADIRGQVVHAAAAGTWAGAAINADLIADDTRMAVEAMRAAHALSPSTTPSSSPAEHLTATLPLRSFEH